MRNNYLVPMVFLLAISTICHSQTIRNLAFNIPADETCLSYASDGKTCLECSPGAYFNTLKKQCLKVNENCATWNNQNGECLTCPQGYGYEPNNGIPIKGQCPEYGKEPGHLTKNCMIPRNLNECKTCLDGFYLDPQNHCAALPPGCARVQNDTCAQCRLQYFYTSSQKCVPVPYNCTTEADSGTCTQCSTGFYLNTQINKCFFLTENCTATDALGNCISCDPGMQLDNKRNCVQLPADCVRTLNLITEGKNEQSVCAICQSGFYANVDGACNPLPANCSAAGTNGNCTACAQGYFLDLAQECAQLPQNCSVADPDGNCTLCNEGFELNQNGDCIQLPPNCFATNQNGTCVFCNRGFRLDENATCIALPPNCIFALRNQTCIFCDQCFYLSQDNSCKPLPANCLNSDRNGACIRCQLGYMNQGNGSCAPLPNGCARADQNSTCAQCVVGYVLDSTSNCVELPAGCASGDINGVCTQCLTGFTFMRTGLCVQIPFGCKTLDNGGVCTVCIQGFLLDPVSRQCSHATPRPDLLSGSNPDCRTQDSDGKCTSCRYFYTLDNGTCVPTGQNPQCQYAKQPDNVCAKCFYPNLYYLDNNNVCSSMRSNCKAFNVQNGDCTQCYSGFTLLNGLCVLNDLIELVEGRPRCNSSEK